jgi:hypothetical protein
LSSVRSSHPKEHRILTSRVVRAKGVEAVEPGGRCGIVIMRAPSARAAATRGSAMMSAKAFAPLGAPVRHSLRTIMVRGALIRSRKYEGCGRLSGSGGGDRPRRSRGQGPRPPRRRACQRTTRSVRTALDQGRGSRERNRTRQRRVRAVPGTGDSGSASQMSRGRRGWRRVNEPMGPEALAGAAGTDWQNKFWPVKRECVSGFRREQKRCYGWFPLDCTRSRNLDRGNRKQGSQPGTRRPKAPSRAQRRSSEDSGGWAPRGDGEGREGGAFRTPPPRGRQPAKAPIWEEAAFFSTAASAGAS